MCVDFFYEMNIELSERGAHPPRVWLAAPRGQRIARDAYLNARTISVLPGFPRGRGKQHPRRARSPFRFGIRAKPHHR